MYDVSARPEGASSEAALGPSGHFGRADEPSPSFDLDAFLDFAPHAMAPPPTYTVHAGDTLQSIAATLHTTVEAIKSANADRLKSYTRKNGKTVLGFDAGDVIVIPGGAAAPSAPAPAPAPTPAPAPGPAPSAPAAEHGWMDTISDQLHAAWDWVTGGNGKPAATEEHAPAPAPSAPAPSAPAPSAPAPSHAKAPAPVPAQTPAPVPSPSTPGTAPMSDLSNAERSAKLSTMQKDEIGELDKFSNSASGRAAAIERGQWLSAGDVRGAVKKTKSAAAFVTAADAMNAKAKFTEDQQSIIAAARDFAASPHTLTPAQEKNAVINWTGGGALLSLDGVSLNSDLEDRLTRYVRFLAWANLVTGPTKVMSVMRSKQDAHKLSVAWMFNLEANQTGGSTLHNKAHRQELVDNVTKIGGTDSDGNKWLSDATVQGLKDNKDDDAALYKYIKKTAAPEANKLCSQFATAAEGYTDDRRLPNVLKNNGVSNHLLGEAVDMKPPYILSNLFDPLIDAIAIYFGLFRACKDLSNSPEHWHFERIGSPPGVEPQAAKP